MGSEMLCGNAISPHDISLCGHAVRRNGIVAQHFQLHDPFIKQFGLVFNTYSGEKFGFPYDLSNPEGKDGPDAGVGGQGGEQAQQACHQHAG